MAFLFFHSIIVLRFQGKLNFVKYFCHQICNYVFFKEYLSFDCPIRGCLLSSFTLRCSPNEVYVRRRILCKNARNAPRTIISSIHRTGIYDKFRTQMESTNTYYGFSGFSYSFWNFLCRKEVLTKETQKLSFILFQHLLFPHKSKSSKKILIN